MLTFSYKIEREVQKTFLKFSVLLFFGVIIQFVYFVLIMSDFSSS